MKALHTYLKVAWAHWIKLFTFPQEMFKQVFLEQPTQFPSIQYQLAQMSAGITPGSALSYLATAAPL